MRFQADTFAGEELKELIHLFTYLVHVRRFDALGRRGLIDCVHALPKVQLCDRRRRQFNASRVSRRRGCVRSYRGLNVVPITAGLHGVGGNVALCQFGHQPK